MKHNWEYKRLGDVCEMKSGSFISADALSENYKYPCFGGNGVRGFIEKYSHDGNYCILGRVGALCGNVHQFDGQFYATEHAIVVSPLHIHNVRWLYYQLSSLNLRSLAKGVAQPVISVGTLNSVNIPIPPLETQERIVKELDELNGVIDAKREQLKHLDLLAQAIFVQQFSNWPEFCPLSYYVSQLTGGKSLASLEPCVNKVLKSGAVTYDYFDGSSTKFLPHDYVPLDNHMVKVGDVIVSRMNTAELVGACAYVFNVDDNIYLPDRLWRVEHKPNANPIFLWKSLISETSKKQIRAKASGTSGSMKNISKPLLLSVQIPKAPLSLQQQFATKIEAIEVQKTEIEASIKELQTLLDSRMDYWFN